MPSTSPSRPMNRPNSVLFLTSPSTVEPTGCLAEKASHGILQRLLEAERDAALGGVDLEHLNLDLLAGRNDLAGMDVLLGPRHFRDVDEAFDARLQLDERAVVGDVGDAALEALADRDSAASIAAQGSSCSCFMPSEMRCVSWLILMMRTLTCWPMLNTSVGWLTRRQAMSVTCSRPSMPPRSTNAP